MNLSISTGEGGDLRVRFPLPSVDDAVAAYVALAQDSNRFVFFDGGADWALFEARGPRWLGVSVDFGSEPNVEIAIVPTLEGDDALDGTRDATELSLSDRLAVAAIARKVFAIEARS